MVRRNTGPKRRHQQDVRDFLLEILGQARRAKNIDLKGQVRGRPGASKRAPLGELVARIEQLTGG